MSDSISNESSGLGDADMDAIIDYVTGELDPAAIAAIEARIANDAVFARTVASYQTLWQTPLPTPPRDLAAAWAAIEQKVAAQTTIAAPPLTEHLPLSAATYDQRRKPAFWTRWIVAPQLLMLATFSFIMCWWFVRYTGERALQRQFHYYTATSHPRTITLADQSQVTLAPGALLVAENLPQDALSGKPRVVHLDGDGTFVVHADPRHPFIVESYGISAVAIGTTFNVGLSPSHGEGGEHSASPPAAPSQALPPGSGIHVTVINGKVLVRRQTPDGRQETIAVLGPGQETSVQTFIRNFKAGWDAGEAQKSIPEAYMEARALAAAESIQTAMMKKHGQ